MNLKKMLPETAGELVGFVPFRPGQQQISSGIALIVTKSYIRLTDEAMGSLGTPEYLVAFMDYIGQRLMMMEVDKNDENSIRIGCLAKTSRRCVISADSLRKEILKLAGKGEKDSAVFQGHKTGTKQPAIIFSLVPAKGES